jgi:hypothetical protein
MDRFNYRLRASATHGGAVYLGFLDMSGNFVNMSGKFLNMSEKAFLRGSRGVDGAGSAGHTASAGYTASARHTASPVETHGRASHPVGAGPIGRHATKYRTLKHTVYGMGDSTYIPCRGETRSIASLRAMPYICLNYDLFDLYDAHDFAHAANHVFHINHFNHSSDRKTASPVGGGVLDAPSCVLDAVLRGILRRAKTHGRASLRAMPSFPSPIHHQSINNPNEAYPLIQLIYKLKA